MASILRILGIILLLVGILLFSGMAIPPFGGKTQEEVSPVQIGAFLEDVVFIGAVPEHPIFPFFTNVKAIFILQSDFPYSCNIVLMYESASIPIAQEIGGVRSISEQGGGNKQITISTMISPQAASESFTIRVKLDNTGSSSITVATRRVDVVYTIFGMGIPGLLVLTGIILTVISFVKGKKSAPKVKKRASPGEWEPTLQWSGASGASGSKSKSGKKRAQMAISSTKGKGGKKTKIVKKTVPQGGAQVGCKFCGKQVAKSAFFCPHCYGKLK
ncbi:MAG: hypothetical protein ACTSQ9_07215 [Candidatus Hodarchaeales archaeon]